VSTLAAGLVAASAAIVLLLGLAHLLYTFRGRKLWPRDDALRARMHEVAPVITRETTMWRAWLGFNASHSFGLILFGVVYADLALAHADLLFGSLVLRAVGLAMLCGWVVLAKLYFFSVPLRGVLLATALYVVGLVAGSA
jgi:hypothetical protein